MPTQKQGFWNEDKGNEEVYNTNPCGISAQKKADLLKLCSKGLIPHRHHAFYSTLSVNDNKKDDLDEPNKRTATTSKWKGCDLHKPKRDKGTSLPDND